MRTIRIFISSPSDFVDERDRARQVIENLRRRYAGRLELEPILLEDLPLQADMSFQEGIDMIMRSRLFSKTSDTRRAVLRSPSTIRWRRSA